MLDQQLDLSLEQAFLINSKQNILSLRVFYVAFQVYQCLSLLAIYIYFLYPDSLLDSFKYAKIMYLVFLVVFFPVWIDFFGENHKTLWLTYMQLGVALGTVSGYLVTSLSLYFFANWIYPYYFQILLLLPCLICYLLVNELQLSTQEQMHMDNQKQSFTEIFKQNINTFFTNQVFVFTMLSLSALFFVVTGIQFWITDYLRIVLLMPHDIVFKAFLIVSLTAPLSGVYFGGLILHNFGGYDGNYAMQIVSIEAFFASVSGLFIPLLNNAWLVLVFLWLLMFFGGSAVPAIMGIMITSIPKEQRSSGNSLSHLFQELLGYLPAPVLYGYIQSLTGGQTSRWGMILLASWGFLGLLFILIGMHYKNKKISIDTSVNESELRDQVHYDNIPKSKKSDKLQQGNFSYIRMQTSIQSGKSVNISAENDEGNSSPLINGMEQIRIRNAYRKQESLSQVMFNISSIMGRGSLDSDLFMIKEDQQMLRSKPKKEIELKVAGDIYLMSEGRYVKT